MPQVEAGTQFYVGNQLVNIPYLGNQPAAINPFSYIQPDVIPQAGLQFWLDPTSYTSSGSNWLAKQGNATGSFTGSYIYSGSNFFNMNTASIMEFNLTSSLNYSTQPNTFFVVGRSSGSSALQHGRLISAKDSNWLMGTYGGGFGAGDELQRAYYDNVFVIADTPYDTQWRVYTSIWQNDSSASFYVNGVWVATSTTAGQSGMNVPSINNGQYQGVTGGVGGNENTQADYGDIILYNRVLSDAEIAQVYNAIKGKYGLT